MKRISTKILAILVLIALGSGLAFSQASLSDLLKKQQAGGADQATSMSFDIKPSTATTTTAEVSLPEATSRAALAMATEDYPSTPGDVYTLVYLKATQPDSVRLVVEGDGTINAGFLGAFTTKGLSFRAVKSQIEKKIAESYPGSNPSLLIASTGLFPVTVMGEVVRAGLTTAWGLSRLSEILQGFGTEYSSLRDVKVLSSDGKSSSYDLFKARRNGDFTQDPYVRPGDRIEVRKAARIVTLEGEVRRPGTYQLLPGEAITELVSYYGDGALENAKSESSILTRRATAEKPEAESLVFDLAGVNLPALLDGDVVRLTSREDFLPVVYLEGALVALKTETEAKTPGAVAPETYTSIRIPFAKGALLSYVLKPFIEQLSANADARNAYVLRGGEKLQVDLEKLLFAYDATLDITVQAGDRIVVPFGLNLAYVKGQVAKAGWVSTANSPRLSSVVSGLLTAGSSLRDVAVIGSNGVTKVYDLFKAERFGDASQDPFLLSGDVIEVKKALRIVGLEGDVRRPGKYQMLANEGIPELVSYYGDGALDSARTDLSVLTRRASAEKPDSESIVFTLGAVPAPLLSDGDTVRIPSREEYLPVIYVEGAVAGAEVGVKKEAQQGNADAVVTEQYRILRLAFRQGQLLSQALRGIRDQIDPRADLKRAFISRKGETGQIAVDLEKLLYSYAASDDVTLKADDKIVIPYGSMYVFVTGEVTKSVWVGITGLTRLSEAMKPLATPFSSLRDVKLKSEDGTEAVFDLFKAERLGDLTQDPYLRPGDIIEVKKASRIVTLEGEVSRPGKYQLLVGEGIPELVSYYGDGALASAKTDLSVLTRKASAERPESESLVFDLGSKSLPALSDGDRVRVPSREEYLPIVYVEGALKVEVQAAQPETAAKSDPAEPVKEPYGIVRVVYRQGQLLSQLVKPLQEKLSSAADLTHAYVVRAGTRISVNLEKLLYSYLPGDDIALFAEDRIVIPFGLTTAFIKGEVKKSTQFEVSSITRLLQILADKVTEFSSLRDVEVTSLDGSVKLYDLYKAERLGDLTQNPYLRPGDVVTVKRAERIVTVEGEVRRPGTYQLLTGESLADLVATYGDGALESARTDLVVVTRKATLLQPSGESLAIDLRVSPQLDLMDGDSVLVTSREDFLPVVYFEGAVTVTDAAKTSEKDPALPELADEYGLARVVFRPGLRLSQAVKSLIDRFATDADLENAYLARDMGRIAVNLEKLMYAYDPTSDIALVPGDRIVIPRVSMRVYVTGEVVSSAWMAITGGTRLSEIVKGKLTKWSLIRQILVKGRDGVEKTYDLLLADRNGDLSQDPVLFPGDTISIPKSLRLVTIEGEIKKPGEYALLPSDGVKELLFVYAEGALESAQTDLSLVTRKASASKPESETLVFSVANGNLPSLLDGDRVRIPSREEYLPIVYIEGAVAGDAMALSDLGKTVQQTSYAVLRLPYRKGMSLSTLLRPIKDKILSSANLTHAFIIRKGNENQLTVNLERLLYNNDLGADALLEPDDKLVIPFGSMYVFVSGEVTKSAWVGITGLTRLRDVVMPLLTRYSSIRDVRVISEDGTQKSYDLFLAERYGNLTQDPFLRPGDEVKISELTRMITIQGEVKRPGTYQLLPDEGLAELLTVYALGFSEKANPSRLGLVRYQSDKDPVGEKIQFDYTKFPDLPLRLYDVVTVPSMQELLPVVWFEGAVGVTTDGASPETSQRTAFTYIPGETVAQAALSNRKLFTAVSDISKAYLLRTDGSKVAVDLGRFIYNYEISGDLELRPGDTIIVPFRQFFVSVSGAVKSPGRYPYIPDRTWEYYVGLAGGFDTDRNSREKLTIYDAESHKVASAGRMIQPEDNIEAASNSFLYGFGKVSAILTTVLSVASLILALIP